MPDINFSNEVYNECQMFGWYCSKALPIIMDISDGTWFRVRVGLKEKKEYFLS